MAEGLGSGTANNILNELCDAGTWTPPDAFWVQLHTGAPGAAGTSNAASNATRQSAVFGSAAAGSITTTNTITWSSVSNTETYSHVSFWDSDTSGTLIATDALETSRGVTAGDNFTINAGDIDVSLGTISA